MLPPILRVHHVTSLLEFLRRKINIQNDRLVYVLSLGFGVSYFLGFGFSILSLILSIITYVFIACMLGEFVDARAALLTALGHANEDANFNDLAPQQQNLIFNKFKAFWGSARGSEANHAQAERLYQLFTQNGKIKELIATFNYT